MENTKLNRILEIIKSCKTIEQAEGCYSFIELPFVEKNDVFAKSRISAEISKQIKQIINL